MSGAIGSDTGGATGADPSGAYDFSSLIEQLQQQQAQAALDEAAQQILGALFNQILSQITNGSSD